MHLQLGMSKDVLAGNIFVHTYPYGSAFPFATQKKVGRGGQELQVLAGQVLHEGLGEQRGGIPPGRACEKELHSTMSIRNISSGLSTAGVSPVISPGESELKSLLLLGHEAQIARVEFLITNTRELGSASSGSLNIE